MAFVPEDILAKIRQYQRQSKTGTLFTGLDEMAAQRRAFEIVETYTSAIDNNYKLEDEDNYVIFKAKMEIDPTIAATLKLRMQSPLEEDVPIEDVLGEDWDEEKE